MGNNKAANLKTYAGYELNFTEQQLDEILNEKSTKYEFNPIEAYEKLSEGDKKALVHLVKAAVSLNSVYLKQDNPYNMPIKEALESAASQGYSVAEKALTLFNIFNGIEGEDGLSSEPIRLFKGLSAFKTKNVFPVDLTKDELVEYLKQNVHLAPAFLSFDTVVIRQDSKLMAVPYFQAFKDEYEAAAKELLLAAQETTHDGFREYLRLQAQALTCHDAEFAYKADKVWANLKGCPLEFTIGRECYDDTFTGAIVEDADFMKLMSDNGITVKSKDFIGVRVGIIDLESTEKMADYKNHLGNLAELMPLKDKYPSSPADEEGEEAKQTLADVDLVCLTGDYKACRPGITIAQNLPNSDKLSVQLNAGNRNVFHRQIRQTENPERKQKLLDALVEQSQHKWYDKEADHLFTIGHELCHALGPKSTLEGRDKKSALGDGYGDIIEESKADLGSLVSVDYFVEKGLYTTEQANSIFLTWAVKQLPLSEPSLIQAHRVREVMQLKYFVEKGAINFVKGGKVSVNPKKMTAVAKEMLEEIIQIQLDGSPVKAKEFADKYRAWDETLQYASDTLKTLSPKPYKILVSPLADKLLSEGI